MVTARSAAALPAKSKFHAILSVVAVGLLTSACAGAGSPLELANASDEPAHAATSAGDTGPQSDLEKATQYWGKQFEKNPREPKNAVNYARNLKAMGQKEQALGVLQVAHGFSSNDRALNSEYGRAALEIGRASCRERV